MKSLLLLLLTLGVVSADLFAAPSGPPAKEAIRTVGRERSAQYLNRLVQVFGEKGVHQPEVWRIIAADGNGTLREFFVNGTGIVSEGPVPRGTAVAVGGPTIPLSAVAIDSTTAFTRAEKVAKASKIGFDSVNYQLRCLELSDKPAWFLQLLDSRGMKVGEVTVSAHSGKVLRTAWFSANPVMVNQTVSSRQPVTAQQAWYRTRNVVNRSAIGVKSGIGRAGQWFRGKVQPTPAAPQYFVPSRAR